ncbi:MAG: MATE family efflux transporter [Clostridiales bacterium]|nr:MATE family efflux transporter [Bacillota bacterium]PWL94834.1 MAG: MATE family efflux transporter [Clostridiales bacterium]
MTNENKMGTMPVRKLLMSMAWPAILSMTINAMYNVVDSIFVSRIGEDALTAVSLVNPIQMMIIAISVGSGVGINSLIARRLGAQNQEAADKAASTSIRIGLFNYLIFFVIGVFFAKPFISGYADEGTFIYDSACRYLQIICIGSLFLNIQVVLEKVLQSTGNMVAPMKCSLTGAIVNIILDPILIFGMFGLPKMGVAGAAIATITGQLCGMIMGITIVIRGEHLVNIKLKGFKMDWRIVGDIYKVGLPSIVMQSIGSFMIIFYNMILVVYSTTAVAVLGIYFRIQSFVFMPVFGLNQGAMPIMGYNYGAKNKERLMSTYKEAFKVALIVMAAGTVLFQTIPAQLLMIFDASEEMLRIGVPALRLISLCFIPAAFGIITGTLFQGTGHGVLSLYASVIRQLIGILPLAFILIRIGGVTLSWLSFPLAEVLGLVYSAVMLKWLYKNEISKL